MKFLSGFLVGLILASAVFCFGSFIFNKGYRSPIPHKDVYYSKIKKICVTKGIMDTASLSNTYKYQTNGITLEFDSAGKRKRLEIRYHGEKRGDTVIWQVVEMYLLNDGYMVTDNATRVTWPPNKGESKSENMSKKEIVAFLEGIR